MNSHSNRLLRSRRRGSALAMVAVMLVAMSGLALALLVSMRASGSLQRRDREHAHARFVAQTGLAQAVYQLQQGHSAALGSPEAPVASNKSRYYVTEENVTGDVVRLTATGLDDRTTARQELVVRRLPSTDWRFGAFGREFVHMDANSRIDSFDSTQGSYASQAINGTGSGAYANANGDVGSNGSIVLEQNAKVWGDANPGPLHESLVLGNAIVSGITSPAEEPFELPTISVPSFTNYGAWVVGSNSSLPSSDRTYTNLTVDNNQVLTIVGPANIVVSNLQLRSGSRIDVDATNGPVQIWVIDNFVMGSNTRLAPTSFDTRGLRLNLLSDNVINPELEIALDLVAFNSNSKFYGTLLAPNAAIVLNSNFEFFGSMLARSIDLHSNASFHFDEALLGAGGNVVSFETLSWREVSIADQ